MLRTGGKIQTDIAARQSTDDMSTGDFVSKTVIEFAHNLNRKLRGRGRKRAGEALGGKMSGPRGPKPQQIKRATKIMKRDKFSLFYFSQSLAANSIMSAAAEIASVSNEFNIFANGTIQTSALGTIEAAKM